MPCRFFVALAVLLAASMTSAVHADDDDTRFLLEQARRAAERRAAPPDELIAPPGSLVYEGRIYEVQTRLEELEPAIYIAINSGQWDRLAELVGRYRMLREHRPALADMAEALLARQRGDHALALRRMQAAHEADPVDVRIRLELARLRFEDNQDGAARAGFASVVAGGLPEAVQMMTQQYLLALDDRARWHGSIALGMGYNDNINQANGDYSCLFEWGGYCLFERRMPEPIGSDMVHYELALGRRIHLGGNHNLQIRPMAYGSHYRRNDGADDAPIKDYSSNTTLLYLGYNWLDARNSISATPYVEHYYRNGHSQYLANGLQLEWRRMLGSRWQLGGSMDAKRYDHTSRGARLAADYWQYQWGVSASYMPQASTTLYGGLDAVRKKYEVEQASSRELALRVGVYHVFDGSAGVFVNAMGIFRASRNDAFDGFLGERRRDLQQVYIVSAGVNAWKIAGMVPELRVRHSINRSNLDWAFGFRQTEASLMLRHSF
ncbi:surface lipoprotein assembly modifier [Pseudothauera nasutitermitis]|nr:surface lipoprotein assembly modifier [Pseudothauera nasutitermitis]